MAQLMLADAPTRDFDLLKSLDIFMGVADTGSMTAAAVRLHITQSAISQQIKLLETEFGTPLFYRDVRPLRLTPAGLTLKNRAGALLLEARQMRSEVRQAAAGNLPHLRIAMLSTFAKHLVPAILRAVQNKALSADNVTITRGMTINHALDLANRDIDIAFTSDAFDETPGFQHLELLRESYLLVTPRGFAR
ncbi:MAG: LysR family transcriptional regulator, partial [Hyphomicrobiales bacterium]|nr:LysR family transcriptional regulator [Hyphomicrobiales bacterium]